MNNRSSDEVKLYQVTNVQNIPHFVLRLLCLSLSIAIFHLTFSDTQRKQSSKYIVILEPLIGFE